MKALVYVLLCSGALFSGCAGPSEERIDPASHRPDLGTGNVPPYGVLMVISERNANVREGGQGEHEVSSNILFSVFDRNGRMMANSDTQEIRLPPGRYVVRTESEQQKEEVFWVTIEAGKTTEVDARRFEENKGAMPVE